MAKVTSLRSILHRTQLFILLVTSLIGGSALLFISIYTIDQLTSKNSALIADTVRHRVEAAVVFQDVEAIEQAISDISQGQEVNRIEVLDQNQHLLAQVDVLAPNADRWYQQWLFQAQSAQPVTIAIDYNQQTIGWVRVYGSSQSILSFAAQVITALLVSLVLIFLCIAYFSYRAHRQIKQSFDRVNYTANLIREQRAFNLRMPQDVISELNQLGETFNALLTELDHWQADMTQENSLLAHQARHDGLTGLANRVHFEEYLYRLYDQPEQRDRAALLFIDGDSFKEINDTYGHQAGDLVLVEMAKRLNRHLRQHDFVARLGGDEFAVMLANIDSADQALVVVKHILEVMREPIHLASGRHVYFSFSVGVALSSQATTPAQLIHHADSAMYTAKLSTRKRYFLFQYE
ncbi:MAG: diguanylate cyclase [Pseudomonadota bacterium]|nr:diguanylate cyclase [Pseudomonadota bacterium]